MKNGLVLFLGVFATLALSWAGLLLAAHKQIGSLPQYKDPIEQTLFPAPLTGIADQGRAVYQDLGCVSCHTQQVRYDGFGSDLKRGWGERGSFAREYIREKTVLIGSSRLGPDLRNVGNRPYASAEYFHGLLYAPESVAPGGNKPAHAFLYETRALDGNQASYKALKLSSKFAPGEGLEVVPTYRAEALVAYLMSLKDTYSYPAESGLNAPAPAKEGSH
ncbi:Cytochrome C oxidase, mono-heme subunit/FixO [Lacunisphaera limnophila]|uniref:Cytochrome C oxidase, mono-heme subunit/FixO n=1 Tax=Lacunisphaera limnophila TaxID=1838286 RepID=A0A1D8AVV2_9BACT|nr:cbb3-type cytochrome c oxidase subunit II [Lacunisphaera limnophila]AOS45019.1 Cytochrome C oxidase, mono-heme subunit/FixO [Lacunisphaera limnophila]